MSDRRYTVTEGQLYGVWLASREWDHGISNECFSQVISTLTPDPVIETMENGAEVVSIADLIYRSSYENWTDGALINVLTAEVTRQVEERTKGYREALENISREFRTNPSFGDDLLGQVLSRICTATRQALANKGGSDE